MDNFLFMVGNLLLKLGLASLGIYAAMNEHPMIGGWLIVAVFIIGFTRKSEEKE